MFISKLAGRYHPFSHLMKKVAPFEWDESYCKTFEKIKRYLSNPQVLEAPIPCRPLILYIAAQEQSLEALCVRKNEEGKEVALYCLSRMLVGAELKGSPIEKIRLSLMFTIQKLKHYMQLIQCMWFLKPIHQVHLIKSSSQWVTCKIGYNIKVA